MKKVLIATFALILFCFISIAQTTVPGGNVYGTWTLGGSPYNVAGPITVPIDSTLIIQPGVNIVFQGHYKFNVQGRVLAIGTEVDSIFFTAADTTTGWWGMRYFNTSTTQDSSLFVFCKLQYGKALDGSNVFNGSGGAFAFSNFSKCRITKCHIVNNYATFSGGGIYCYSSSPVITYNNIIGNRINQWNGGGIYCELSASIKIIGNNIKNNIARSGGGISCSADSIIIARNNISFNISLGSVGDGGGGIYCRAGTSSIITQNTISYNSSNGASDRGGGGIFCYGDAIINENVICNNNSISGGGIYCFQISNPTITNNIIINNTATAFGGGIICDGGNGNICNNTIANNYASGGGGLYCTMNAIFKNDILYGNYSTSGNGHQVYLYDDQVNPTFAYCDIQGGSAGIYSNGGVYMGAYTNNIDSDPLFVSPSGGAGNGFNVLTADWSLQSISPCIDAGTPDVTGLNLPSTDLAGNPRITVCRIDIGAYEYQNGIPALLSISQTDQILCSGDSTATIQADASGGTLPYTYLWSTGETTMAISNIPAGNYSVTVGNASGCTRTESITVAEPAGMILNTTQTDIDCSGNCIGSATVNPSGGTGPYSYLWSTIPSETTATTSSTLCTGLYYVTVTDDLGCTKISSVTISTPGSLSFTTSQSEVSCFAGNNGSIQVNASGGNGTLQYSIDGGINYQLSNNFTGLSAGTYDIVVKDANGCQSSVIPLIISEPSILSGIPSQINVYCYGASNGSATIDVSGGSPSYTYLWNSSPSQTTSTAIDLPIGNYNVTVSDTHGCSIVQAFSIVSTLQEIPICLVTVDTITWKNKIMWEKNGISGVLGFNIFKEVGTGVYTGIGYVPLSDPAFYIDFASSPEAYSNRYKISVLDTCGSESTKSFFHKTVNLTIAAFGSTMGLNWNDYVDEGGTFVPVNYYIYRGTTSSSMQLLDSVPGGTNSYNDVNVFNFYYYIIGVKKAGGCNTNKSDFISFSNRKDNGSFVGINSQTTGTITVSPNPFTESTTIKFYNPGNKTFSLTIKDSEGRVVRKAENVTGDEIMIERKDLKPGMYFMELTGECRTFRGKMMVE